MELVELNQRVNELEAELAEARHQANVQSSTSPDVDSTSGDAGADADAGVAESVVNELRAELDDTLARLAAAQDEADARLRQAEAAWEKADAAAAQHSKQRIAEIEAQLEQARDEASRQQDALTQQVSSLQAELEANLETVAQCVGVCMCACVYGCVLANVSVQLGSWHCRDPHGGCHVVWCVVAVAVVDCCGCRRPQAPTNG